ncbi:MAG TPA: DNA primase [Longimicrobiales bacterium]|nr:DNA primase [Longimicrobiales bacterium]
MIPDSVVEEVRDRADIVEIIGEHVQLKRAGREFKALCPFHNEKTPSFYVVPGKGFYKCFGCGESGDIYSFLMAHLGLSFNEAVEQLAHRVGVEIPRDEPRPEDDALRPYREAVAFAADFYRRQLLDPEAGEKARRYLSGRGISEDAAERFMLGYAPDGWRVLREAAHTHGITDEVLEEAGLIKRSEKVDEPYDRLRDRLIFPITDTRGRVIAFGGRVLGGDTGPKYLNSPETPLYHKGQELYGLYWSKGAIRREGAALVVEGYMDYVSLAAAGVEHVVAALGTAMTPEQARLVTRYASQILLLYDSDAAGLRATFRSGDEILRAGGHPMVVTLPPGEDPDSVARAGGADGVRPYLEGAVDLLERKFQILEERGYFEGVDGIRKALDGLLPTLRAAQDPTLRDIYVDRVAKRTGVRRETLEAEIRSAAPSSGRAAAQRVERPGGRGGGRDGFGAGGRSPGGPARPRRDETERLLLLLLVRDASRVEAVSGVLTAEDFRGQVNRELFEALQALAAHGGDPARFEGTKEARSLYEELMGDEEEIVDPARSMSDTVETMLLRPQLDRLAALREELGRAEGAEQEALMAQVVELDRLIKKKVAEFRTVGGKASRNRWRPRNG